MPSSGVPKDIHDECPPIPAALVEHLEAIFDLSPPRLEESTDALRYRAGVAAVIRFLRRHHELQQSDGAMGKVL